MTARVLVGHLGLRDRMCWRANPSASSGVGRRGSAWGGWSSGVRTGSGSGFGRIIAITASLTVIACEAPERPAHSSCRPSPPAPVQLDGGSGPPAPGEQAHLLSPSRAAAVDGQAVPAQIVERATVGSGHTSFSLAHRLLRGVTLSGAADSPSATAWRRGQQPAQHSWTGRA